MPRLIDAKALFNDLADYWGIPKDWDGQIDKLCEDALASIENAPTVDAVEVVHGRWIVKGQEVFCSHCDKESGYNHWGASAFSDYCPNCGAKMDGKENQ